METKMETSDNLEDGEKEKSSVVVESNAPASVDNLDEPETKDEKKTPTKRRGKIRKKKQTSARKKGGSTCKKKISIRKKDAPLTKVDSLVFLNLETTGLPQEVGKTSVQIAELSMVAISRRDFEELTFKNEDDIRIIQKLRLCIRPRSKVSSSAAEIHGLYNLDLRNCAQFDRNVAGSINCFPSHLSKPVCLLAHNGNSYAFKLLKAELSRLSMSLPSDLLIADTMSVFRAVVPKSPPHGKAISSSVKYTKRGISCTIPNLHLYFFDKDPTCKRTAESNCIILAKLCHEIKDSMLPWVDKNCKDFDSVAPMWETWKYE